ncbi:MHC class II transactivator isoform X1 [Labrus bergylta]|uniref:MHC class II transactivator isoform X1 n=2 Tax=Labrus bergylta TaxID=56723 RepID=UPI0033135D68
MAQFEEVLDRVRLALTWASPAEIQALLEGLVKERIISEAYGKSFNLHRLTESGTANRLRADRSHSQRFTNNWPLNQDQLSQERKYGTLKCTESTCNQTTSESSPVNTRSGLQFHPLYNKFQLNHGLILAPIDQDCRCSLDDELTELPSGSKSTQEPVSDSVRINEGNLVDEKKEWLEQLEQAARRIAVPLWQHWDQGRRRLLPLDPRTTIGWESRENKETGGEARCPLLNMEEETELSIACKTPDFYGEHFLCTEEELKSLTGGLRFSESVRRAGWNPNDLDISGALGHPSAVRVSADTKRNTTDRLEDALNVSSEAERTETPEGFLCLPSYQQSIIPHRSLCTPEDTCSDALDRSLNSHANPSMQLGVIDSTETFSKTSYGAKMCGNYGKTDLDENKAEGVLVDPHWGTMMQELEQDPFLCPDLGELPDDLSEYLNEDCLKTIDPDVLFGDPWFNYADELNTFSDVGKPTDPPSPDGPQQRQEDKLTDKTNHRRKRQRVSRIQRRTDENTPSRPKRQRAAGRPKTKAVETESTVSQGSEPSSPKLASHSTTPQRVLHLQPSIRFITIPEAPRYHVVQTLSLSPPVIGLPISNTAATPTYVFVPATSPPCKRKLPPLSPVDGAVVPVQMSSSPPGSLSDTASKAMSSPVASPVTPSNESSYCNLSNCKEGSQLQSPPVLEIPETVREYIQEAKSHMNQTCQAMEEGLSLTSHYVDVKVSQREILCSGKNTNKSLDKEMVLIGNMDQRKSLMGCSQIFEGLNGNKCYILLLGNTGMGKTTLIRKLCLDWSRGCIPQFDFVFLLDGKALTLKEPNHSLQTLLLNSSSFAPSCMDPEAVYTQILAASKRVLIIFDGFDEVRDYETLLQTQEKDLMTSLQKDTNGQIYTIRQLYSAILQRVLLPGCTLLLSTRPRGTANQLLRRTDSLVEMYGFNPKDVETYLSRYFTDPALRESALDYLKKCSFLHLLCWNPGLCRLACLVLEQAKSLAELPRTLTGLCHQVLCQKLERDNGITHLKTEVQTEISVPSVEESQTHPSSSSHSRTKPRSQVRTRSRTQPARKATKQKKKEEVDGEDVSGVGRDANRREKRELLTQLSSLAWEGVKANSSILPAGRTISDKLRALGHRTGLFLSYHLRRRQVVSSEEREEKSRGEKKGEKMENRRRTESGGSVALDDLILFWANPFLQSYLAGVHLSLSRTVTDRIFQQNLPFQSGPKWRRRSHREELELAQRFTVGLLFNNRTELQRLHSYTDTASRDIVNSKQALLRTHLESLSHDDLSPAQVLEACHHVYEASFTCSDGNVDIASTTLVAHLAVNLPEVVTFHGVPLNPSDVFTVQNVLDRGRSEGRSFSLDLEDSVLQLSGLRALVALNNINTYRASIADVITLWEELEQSGEEELLQGSVSKFKIHPLRATQVCHIEHLAKLVNIHMQKKLSDSSSQSSSILSEGVPAVKELQKLDFELGPEMSSLALPKLWELLPGLQNLQHLDLENSKVGDKGAEKLADVLVSLCNLEILNLSQNCIGDQGVTKLLPTLRDLPKLHCLSLYSNVISDKGAESLAVILPHMRSLIELDVKYNKLTDVGAQSLGASLRNCKKMKTLRMWNQCIPYGVFEWLQQQDNRIEWH